MGICIAHGHRQQGSEGQRECQGLDGEGQGRGEVGDICNSVSNWKKERQSAVVYFQLVPFPLPMLEA